MDHRPAPNRFSKNVSILSYPRQKPSLVCIIPKRWSPCPLLLSRRHIKVKLPPLGLAGANFWHNKIYPSCQIHTNLALCALYNKATLFNVHYQLERVGFVPVWPDILMASVYCLQMLWAVSCDAAVNKKKSVMEFMWSWYGENFKQYLSCAKAHRGI